MVSLVEALRVLNTTLFVEGVSSPDLAAHVNHLNQRRPHAKTCVGVPGLDRRMRLRAVDALLELARASRNPKNRSVAAAYQWWAFLRYLAFFEADGGYLTVGAEGRSFVHNQRRVASEELGIAFSLLVGRRWTQLLHGDASLTTVTDVEVDLAGRSPSVAQLPGRTKRPDWLLSVRDPSSLVVRTYLLESKGTASDDYARTQLASAARQLTAVTVHGRTRKGLAVSTVSGRGRVRYVAVDPGAEPEPVLVEPERLVHTVVEGSKRPRQSKVDRSDDYLAHASVYWSLVGLADLARNSEALQSLDTRIAECLTSGGVV